MSETIPFQDLTQEQMQDIVTAVVKGEMTLQEVKGFTDEQMEAIYSIGYNLYQAGKYNDAVQVFTWLGIFNPFVSKYWLGLGASLQMIKDFENALNAYAVAAITSEPEDPVPHLHAGECYVGMGDIEEAGKAFQMAADFSKDKPKYAKTYQKALAFLEIIKEVKLEES
ncbi:MAG: SycD/LcrH family type III secretion system chaperone [Thermodesulforhabdaceae bacterium]|jgi:type III secretion system low calcium response chaperone LcrH/SycD